MAISVVMPALEMAQETGKVVAWLKQEGQSVKKGEPLLEIETDKAVVEVEALGEGLLGGITAAVGDVVPVGHTIAWLLAPGESVPTAATVAPTARRTDAPAVAAAGGPSSTPMAVSASERRVSPKARRLAAEYRIDLESIRGSGAGGEILTEDVLAAVHAQDAAPAAAPVPELGAVGRLMAERTTASWTTVPHFFVVRNVDAGELLSLRDQRLAGVQQSHSVKLTLTDLFIAIAARALRTHPRMNASWAQSGIRSNDDINIALAIATSEGVVAPVVHKADALGLGEIAARRLDLAARTQSQRLQPGDLASGTFTISNLGMYDVDAFTAIVVQPQAAILAVAAVTDRVVPAEGRPTVRPMVTLTLSSDHRVVDGARAAMFMRDLCEMLRNPARHLD